MQMGAKGALIDVESSTEVDSDGAPETSDFARSQFQKHFERPSIVALALLFFLVYEAFIWGLPKYAQWQYDLKLGDENHTIFENYCWTPAEHIVCGWNPHTGHQTYKEIVDNNPNLSYRYKSDGQGNRVLYGCGCGEGIFADYVCPYVPPNADFSNVSYGISQYIGTAPASGAMGAVSMVPLTSMWYYGAGPTSAFANLNPSIASWSMKTRWLLDLFVFGTLLVFQVAYGGFLSFTWCVAHKYHGEVTKFMLVAVLFHWIFVSIGIGWKTLPAKLLTGTIWFLVIVAIFGQLEGLACNSPTGSLDFFNGTIPVKCEDIIYDSGLGFWLYECLELSAYFAIAPVLLAINCLYQ